MLEVAPPFVASRKGARERLRADTSGLRPIDAAVFVARASSGVRAGRRRRPAHDFDYGDQAAYNLAERERESGRIEELRGELGALDRPSAGSPSAPTVSASRAATDPRAQARMLPAAERTAEEQRRHERLGR